MTWTWVLSILALTVPPSAAYVVSLLVQLRTEREKKLNAQHEQVLINHEQQIDDYRMRVEEMRGELAEHTKQISLLTERL